MSHELTIEEEFEDDPVLPQYKWRWVCSCGALGKWTYQSRGVADHGWRQHMKKAGFS